MRRILFPLIVIAAIAAGCAKNAPVITEPLKVQKAFELDSLTGSNSVSCTAYYNDEVYYVQAYADNFAVRRLDLEGNETLRFEIPRGNGPGEARHSLGIVANEKGIYFSDFALRRISRFDLQGNYLDCIDFSEDTGIVVFFDIMGSEMYTCAIDTVYMGKIDLGTGAQTALIPREGKTLQEIGSTVSGGIVACDRYNGEIYMGWMSAPYKIERYDKDLKKLGEYTYNLEKEYKPAKIYPGPNIAGDFTISSMAITEKHIYAPHISAIFVIRNNQYESKPFTPELFRFDKSTGKLDRKYFIEGITGVEGGFSILYADDEKIVAVLDGFGDWVKELYPQDTPAATQSVVVLKKQ